MSQPTKPFVLHVDDVPDELRSWALEVTEQGQLDIEVCHPDDVTLEHLRRASLVLVDFKLSQWPGRANAGPIACQPANGLALLSVLQEHALVVDAAKPRAFALYTSVIGDVARGLPHLPQLVARANNLEWVFEKTSPNRSVQDIGRSVGELASAIAHLPPKWPGAADEAARVLQGWLGLSTGAPWFDAAWESVQQCRPPIHNFAEHTLGVGTLRWALHKILPYPTFLLDDAHVAARLRVSLESFTVAADSAPFQRLFGSSRYDGQLKSIQGRRWWRSGIEQAVFNLTEDMPGNLAVLHQQLGAKVSGLSFQEKGRLFATLDGEFRTKTRLAHESESVVEVRPDDWPLFADEAWALEADMNDAPSLQATRTVGR
jgi:hypothetical protein